MRILGIIGSSYTIPNYNLTLTATNTQTWTVPAGVTEISVYVIGGGSSGVTGNNRANQGNAAAKGGNSGAAVAFEGYAVTPGQNYAITVGAVGGASQFGNLANAQGGSTTNTAPTASSNVAGATILSGLTGPNAALSVGYNTLARNLFLTGAGGTGGGGGYAGVSNNSSTFTSSGDAGQSAGGFGGGSGGAGGNAGYNRDFNSAFTSAGSPGLTANQRGGGGGGGGSGGLLFDYRSSPFTPSVSGGSGGAGGAGLAGQVLVYTR
jgi:hypothetical protein